MNLCRLALLLGLLAWSTSAPAALALVRPPYLQMQGPTSITIRWTTNENSDSDVWIGVAPDSLTTQVNEAGATTEHIVEISSLVADTKYYYSVGESTGPTVLAGGDTDHYFTTQPVVGSTGLVRVWFISDIHEPSGNGDMTGLANTIDGMLGFLDNERPDVILLGGDNAGNHGTEAEYDRDFFSAPMSNLTRNIPFWPALGNHECYPGYDNQAQYLATFSVPEGGELGGEPSGSGNYYSFDYANMHIAVVDDVCTSVASGSDQLTWLATDLGDSTAEWLIVVFHAPPYADGLWNSDTEPNCIAARTYLVPVMESAGVDIVLSGHDHAYERSGFIHGHTGLSTTFDPPTMVVQSGVGGCCKDPAYTKVKRGVGTVYVVSGTANVIFGIGDLDYPAMVKNFGHDYSASPPGNTDQGSFLLEVQGAIINAYSVKWTRAAREHFQIRHVQ